MKQGYDLDMMSFLQRDSATYMSHSLGLNSQF